VLDVEVLIVELFSVYRLTAGTLYIGVSQFFRMWFSVQRNGSHVMVGEVSTLKHEVRNHTVETRAFVAEPRGASAELTEIVGSLWNLIVVELEGDAPCGLTVDGDVEESVGHNEGSSKM